MAIAKIPGVGTTSLCSVCTGSLAPMHDLKVFVLSYNEVQKSCLPRKGTVHRNIIAPERSFQKTAAGVNDGMRGHGFSVAAILSFLLSIKTSIAEYADDVSCQFIILRMRWPSQLPSVNDGGQTFCESICHCRIQNYRIFPDINCFNNFVISLECLARKPT